MYLMVLIVLLAPSMGLTVYPLAHGELGTYLSASIKSMPTN